LDEGDPARLDSDFKGAYRFLARPYPSGANDYLDAVERNIAIVRQRTDARSRPAD